MFGTYQRLRVSIHASNLQVIRATRRKFKPACWHDRQFRDGRHAVYRSMLAYHAKARATARAFRL